MMKWHSGKARFWAGAIAWLTVLASATSPGGEPARQFLQGLRDRGYYDSAVEYLNQMKTSKLAPVDLREAMLYELATVLIEASRQQRDIVLREKQLDEARDSLSRFVAQNPDHPLVNSANGQLGNLLVERARIKVEQAKQPKADKTASLAAARQQYEDAYRVFGRSQDELKERLAKMKVVDPKDEKAVGLRDQLRSDYLQVQLLAAAVREEAAETVVKGSQEYTAMLTEAAAQYGAVYDKYRTRLAGLYARLYQGRCNQKLDKLRDALTLFSELLEQPDSPEEFRTLKGKTMQLAAQAWLASEPPLYREAIKWLEPWLDNARPVEAKQPEWLELRLALAEAQWGLAEAAKKTKANDPQAKRWESDARKNALFVAKQTGDLQRKARELAAKFGGTEVAEDSAQKTPKTFTEAKDAGREVLDALQTTSMVLQTFPSRIAGETDAKVKADLQRQLEEAQQTAEKSVREALAYFHKALELADDKTSSDDLNLVRYFLCFLHFSAGEFYEAGLLGEFVAKRYPDSSGARQCAKIAMAAYLKLYVENKTDDKGFESRKVTGIASYLAKTWSDQPEAIDALNTLVPLMIKAGKLEEAEKYLNDIPPDSPKRGEAEMKTGQAMWSAYLLGMQDIRKWENGEEVKPEGVDLAAKKAALDQIKARAQKILEDGVTRMKGTGKVDEAAATASLSLAQIYVDTGQADKAVTVLEDAQTGPLPLLQASSPAAQRPGFAGETYKTALRAYISSLAGSADADAVIKKAAEVMTSMKEAVPPDQLVAVYLSLARDLEQQMKLASPEARKALSVGFETFLKQIRSAATEFSVLNWVAETFSGIAAGFDTAAQGKPGPSEEARKYYDEALATYQAILKTVKFDDPKRKTQILLRQAQAYRHVHQFTKARDIYRDVLRENNAILNIQVEAAKLHQEWAVLAKDEDKSQLYMRAMAGSERDPVTGNNTIWGWGRLFQVAAKYPQFRDVFHEARYNLAFCRLNLARVQKSKAEQQQHLKKAKDSILQTQQLFGSGPEWDAWKPRYEALMKEIQAALGEKPSGLPQIQPPAGAAPAGKEAKDALGKPAAGPVPPPLKPPAGPLPPAAKKAA
jgi:hypothetical protein